MGHFIRADCNFWIIKSVRQYLKINSRNILHPLLQYYVQYQQNIAIQICKIAPSPKDFTRSRKPNPQIRGYDFIELKLIPHWNKLQKLESKILEFITYKQLIMHDKNTKMIHKTATCKKYRINFPVILSDSLFDRSCPNFCKNPQTDVKIK